MASPQGRERGGVVVANGAQFELRELPNHAASRNRYITVLSRAQTLSNLPAGFWHSHSLSALPSPADLVEIVRLNRRFGASFFLCVLGARSFSITRFHGWKRPTFVHESLPAQPAGPHRPLPPRLQHRDAAWPATAAAESRCDAAGCGEGRRGD
jgi:hypothetical protein